MKELTYFRLPGCPYCRRAENWLSELMDDNPEYKKIRITYINENEQEELADSYDYYYVPTFFCGDKKLHEGAASKEKIKNVLDHCLE